MPILYGRFIRSCMRMKCKMSADKTGTIENVISAGVKIGERLKSKSFEIQRIFSDTLG